FVIDIDKTGKNYASNVAKVKKAGIKYVARVVVFPLGGNPSQVKSQQYWANKYQIVQKAINLGADEIQLDYIRYNTKQPPVEKNTQDVFAVLKYFREKTKSQGVPLQIDVFGETSYKPSLRIGQNIKTFAPQIDVLCPMLYPSHFEPYKKHAITPYETVYNSLESIKRQFNQKVPFKIVAYIELSNYRYKMSHAQRIKYIQAQMKAVKDANVHGWYAWSPNNHYDILFEALRGKSLQTAKN
ncbi:MAG TPA: putative glycoside hydrolase, partial [Gammaproteobacteria bacterium]|nr:putative glycoside hydrolase [Gammaproteobacteria bacterium]